MREGQCFGCYDDAMFRYFGQTNEFNPTKIQHEYVEKLKEAGAMVDCVTCGRKVEYVESNGKWTEVPAK
mgnify:CR=1 FL=1